MLKLIQPFLIISLLFSINNSYSQVAIEGKKYSYLDANKYYSIIDSSVTVPYFRDKSPFFKSLNDSIRLWYNLNQIENQSKDSVNNAIRVDSAQKISNDSENTNNVDRDMMGNNDIRYNTTFKIFLNNKRLLCFDIDDHWDVWKNSMDNCRPIIIDVKNKKYLNINSFFNPKNKKKIMRMFDDSFLLKTGYSPPGVDTKTEYHFATEFKDIIISETSISAYYIYDVWMGVRAWTTVDIPLREINKYITKKSRKLLQSK